TSPSCRKDGSRLVARTTDGVVRCDGMVSNKEDKSLSAHGPEPTVPAQQTRRHTTPTGRHEDFTLTPTIVEVATVVALEPRSVDVIVERTWLD
ncbi:hypothetical protein GW17_00052416, partial [Ensete ventricosum]